MLRLLLFQSFFFVCANSLAQTKPRISPSRPCRWDADAEYREKPQHGSVNIIYQVVGFDVRNDNCWYILGEYYYNAVPELGVKTQRIYFVNVPKGTPAIRSLAALKASPFRSRTFFECIYDTVTGYRFVNYPFAPKKAHR